MEGARAGRVRPAEVAAIVGLGLALRLAAMPFAEVMDADATWRVWYARLWLDDPGWITHSVWGPLHVYWNALALAAGGDPVFSITLMHVLAGVGAAVLVYWFATEEFGGGAFLAGLAAAVWPLGFRNSLMPLPEIVAAMLVMGGMVACARVRRGEGGFLAAMAGGLCLSLAGGLRFETWLLIPLLGLVLWRRRGLMSVFVVAAALFPAVWMVSCYLATGDALSSVHASSQFAREVAGIERSVPVGMLAARIGFYPLTLALGLTPLVALGCAAGMWLTLNRDDRGRVWLWPPAVLMAALIMGCLMGSITLKGRYILICGTLCLPFLARLVDLEFVKQWGAKQRRIAAAALLASVPTLAYLGHALPGPLPMHAWKNLDPVPRVAPETRELARRVAEQLREGDGLIVDFIDWQTTEFLGLESRLHPSRVLILTGAELSEVNVGALAEFVQKYGDGVLVLSETSKFRKMAWMDGGLLQLDSPSLRMKVDPLFAETRAGLYRYRRVE